MPVLAFQGIGQFLRMQQTQCGDVDVESVGHVDPPGVDDVVSRTLVAEVCPRIHVEEVLSSELLIGGHVRRDGVVEVIAHPSQCRIEDLHIDIPVPGEKLLAQNPKVSCDCADV